MREQQLKNHQAAPPGNGDGTAHADLVNPPPPPPGGQHMISSWVHAFQARLILCAHISRRKHRFFSQVQQCAARLQPEFAGIDALVGANLRRVQRTFRAARVAPHHFAGSTGYGHGDLGRAVLDQARVLRDSDGGVWVMAADDPSSEES